MCLPPGLVEVCLERPPSGRNLEGSWVKIVETNGKNKIQRTNGKNYGPGLREAPQEEACMDACIRARPVGEQGRRDAQRGHSQFTAVFVLKYFLPHPLIPEKGCMAHKPICRL